MHRARAEILPCELQADLIWQKDSSQETVISLLGMLVRFPFCYLPYLSSIVITHGLPTFRGSCFLTTMGVLQSEHYCLTSRVGSVPSLSPLVEDPL
jgi:hypothetical protein